VKSWLWNGRAFEPATSVPLTDRGFRYGMSLFESMRVWNGTIEFWPQHQQRLLSACGECDFPLPESALVAAGPLLESAGMNGFARVYVTAGDGGPATAVTASRVFLLLESREAEREESWDICFHDDHCRPLFSGLKTANYWFNTAALTHARARGFGEAVLFNDLGEVVSACCANIFVVQGDRILTPGRGAGCRLGIVRDWVIKRRKVEERRLRREDVVNADEIFLTNSWLGVMPVSTLEGRPLGPRSIGPKLAAEMERRREGGADNLSA
jgi:branched-subunit amino acid aminotransferase/4-amino-4-deoxychorismate lyase